MSRQCCVTQAMLRSRRWARDRAAASRPGIKHDADVSMTVMMIVDDDGDDGDNVDDDCDVDYDFSSSDMEHDADVSTEKSLGNQLHQRK